MKKIYFVFTIFIIVIFSYDFSFAVNKTLTLPISPQTFVDAGAPPNSKLFVFSGFLVTNYNDGIFKADDKSSVTFYTFFKDSEGAFNDSTKSYKHFMYSYNVSGSKFMITSCSRGFNNLPAYINGKIVSSSSGGLSVKGRVVPSVYHFDGKNVTLVEGEDVNNSLSETFRKGDEMILFEKPKDNSVVFAKRQLIGISLSNLKFKAQWFTIGNNWGKRLKNSGYDVRFSINGKDVDYLSENNNVIYTKVPSANVLHLSFDQDFKDGEKYVLKTELFKDGESIAWHKINVICQSTFTDVDGDGFDDNTGLKIPGRLRGGFGSLSDFIAFISSFFQLLLDALLNVTRFFREFVASSSEFAKILVSIFSANPVISSIFTLSLSIAVFLRIIKR